MTHQDIRTALDQWLGQDRPHHERLAGAVAYISEAFKRRGLQATLVGGGAIELHAPGSYVTGDIDLVIDLVIEGAMRRDLEDVFSALGFERTHRHWIREELYVEVPSTVLTEPIQNLSLECRRST